MDEPEANMSSDGRKMTPSADKPKPKKRSLVERELETSLTARVTSPAPSGEGTSTSRYGRARRVKTDTDFCNTEKAVAIALKSPKFDKTPVKSPTAYKMHASNSPVRVESIFQSQIENIYTANISLSRFGSDEKPGRSPSPAAKKFPKTYVKTDLIQTREKQETITLIKNLLSPNKSAHKPDSHLNNDLDRSSEKYALNGNMPKQQNGYTDKASIVKTLDFDSKQKSKNEDVPIVKALNFDSKSRRKDREPTTVLSKSELFDLEATCGYQVGDLAWARMGTYPFWPCIVTREPDTNMFVRKKLFGRIVRNMINVTFFGDNGRRSWIVDTMLRSFQGLKEFEATRDQFKPEDKKKDPRLYAAFFISEKKQALWLKSVKEAETFMKEPKRLRIDLLYNLLEKSKAKINQKSQKKITRTDSDVSLSESLLDTLFSEDDAKSDDHERVRKKRISLDVSEVVTACLDNMAARTGLTQIQKQSHMDRWLQKAKSMTPEKSQLEITVTVEKVDEAKVKANAVEKRISRDEDKNKSKKKVVSNTVLQKPYSLRKSTGESNLLAIHNEHDYSAKFNVENCYVKLENMPLNDNLISKSAPVNDSTQARDKINKNKNDLLSHINGVVHDQIETDILNEIVTEEVLETKNYVTDNAMDIDSSFKDDKSTCEVVDKISIENEIKDENEQNSATNGIVSDQIALEMTNKIVIEKEEIPKNNVVSDENVSSSEMDVDLSFKSEETAQGTDVDNCDKITFSSELVTKTNSNEDHIEVAIVESTQDDNYCKKNIEINDQAGLILSLSMTQTDKTIKENILEDPPTETIASNDLNGNEDVLEMSCDNETMDCNTEIYSIKNVPKSDLLVQEPDDEENVESKRQNATNSENVAESVKTLKMYENMTEKDLVTDLPPNDQRSVGKMNDKMDDIQGSMRELNDKMEDINEKNTDFSMLSESKDKKNKNESKDKTEMIMQNISDKTIKSLIENNDEETSKRKNNLEFELKNNDSEFEINKKSKSDIQFKMVATKEKCLKSDTKNDLKSKSKGHDLKSKLKRNSVEYKMINKDSDSKILKNDNLKSEKSELKRKGLEYNKDTEKHIIKSAKKKIASSASLESCSVVVVPLNGPTNSVEHKMISNDTESKILENDNLKSDKSELKRNDLEYNTDSEKHNIKSAKKKIASSASLDSCSVVVVPLNGPTNSVEHKMISNDTESKILENDNLKSDKSELKRNDLEYNTDSEKHNIKSAKKKIASSASLESCSVVVVPLNGPTNSVEYKMISNDTESKILENDNLKSDKSELKRNDLEYNTDSGKHNIKSAKKKIPSSASLESCSVVVVPLNGPTNSVEYNMISNDTESKILENDNFKSEKSELKRNYLEYNTDSEKHSNKSDEKIASSASLESCSVVVVPLNGPTNSVEHKMISNDTESKILENDNLKSEKSELKRNDLDYNTDSEKHNNKSDEKIASSASLESCSVVVVPLNGPTLDGYCENKLKDIKEEVNTDSDTASTNSELDDLSLIELKKRTIAKSRPRRNLTLNKQNSNENIVDMREINSQSSLPKIVEVSSSEITINCKSEAVVEKDQTVVTKRILRPRIDTPVESLNPTQESSPDKKIKEEIDSETASITSEDSNVSTISTKRRGRAKDKASEEDKMKDPEFVRYLELRQDTLIDEHPELSYDEIVAYLYRTWLYEQSCKSDIVKSHDKEQSNLVKGTNPNVPQVKTKKRPKQDKNKLINIDKVFNKELIDEFPSIPPKDKPKRNTSQPCYAEEYSDIEDEIKMFEIFKDQKEKPKTPEIIQQIDIAGPSGIKQETVEKKEEIGPEEYYDEVEAYFEELTKPKPNIFKGFVREKVCEICEKTSNLVKCKGCNGMFHIECVKKETDIVDVPVPVRKKKKKPRGRRPKSSTDSNGLDESHSDEKSQDASVSEENKSFEEKLDESHIVVADVDNFEAQVAAKMKEMIEIDDKMDYDSYSSDECLDWRHTVAGKCEIVDVKLKPKKPEIDITNFKCNNCQKDDVPLCFVCKSPVSPKSQINHRQKCQVAHCHKFYHVECLECWPQTQFNTVDPSKSKGNVNEHSETLTCPRHVCHTCVCDDPRGCKTRFSGDKLARCVRCPATYHSFTKCLPAGTQILTASHIICPRHYEHRPGKVPCHVNTGWCFICAQGGTLICCEYCPTSFHAECLQIDPPDGGYMCEDCETGRLPLYGEMVWVKLGHYRWWPGIVLHPHQIPPNIMAVRHSPGEFVVRFFGQYDHYWVNRGRVFPYQEGDSGRTSSQKSKIEEAFAKAMEHAQRAYEILKTLEENEEECPDLASSLLPPHYVKLKSNKPYGSVMIKREEEESSLTQCECDPSDPQPCGPASHCLNRMLLTECGPSCRAGDRCNNRAFERREYPRLTAYRTKHRGWGLKALEDIKAGQFVIEYVGELIDEEEFRRRMRRKHEVRDENFYFLTLDKERMIDAGPKGNLARFMNHCCEPNCETQKWTVLGDIRVGLFALKDIPANSELTFNYNLECAGIEKKRCMCGAKRCSGYIGAKPKQEEKEPQKKPKVAAKRPYKKRKPEDIANDKNKPKRPVGRPPKPRELTEIEKDLLIIKNATNGISSDSEGSGRLSSVDAESERKDTKALKRKRVSFSSEDVDSKRVKYDEDKTSSEID